MLMGIYILQIVALSTKEGQLTTFYPFLVMVAVAFVHSSANNPIFSINTYKYHLLETFNRSLVKISRFPL